MEQQNFLIRLFFLKQIYLKAKIGVWLIWLQLSETFWLLKLYTHTHTHTQMVHNGTWSGSQIKGCFEEYGCKIQTAGSMGRLLRGHCYHWWIKPPCFLSSTTRIKTPSLITESIASHIHHLARERQGPLIHSPSEAAFLTKMSRLCYWQKTMGREKNVYHMECVFLIGKQKQTWTLT